MAPHDDPARRRLAPYQVAALALLVVALVGSVTLQLALAEEPSATAGGELASGLVAAEAPPAAEPGPLERWLPPVTEASFFGLLGFAVGYATRKLVKLLLILVAVVFVAVQALAWAGWIEVDWSALPVALGRVADDVRARDDLSAFLAHRIPAAGGLLAGVVLGFRRG